MTKKRIADLLKEEVEKTADSSAGGTTSKAASTSKRTPAKAASKSTSRTSKTTTAKTTTAKAGTAKTSTAKTASARRSKTASATKTTRTATAKTSTASTAQSATTLAKKVAELEAALKTSQKQVAGLQEDLETHQGRIYELKDNLEAAEREATAKDKQLTKVTKELEDAKDMIRKLTEISNQPAQTKKEGPAQPKPSHPVLGADLATNRHTLSVRQQRTSRKAIPEYAIQRGEQNSMLSDDDIGWVD